VSFPERLQADAALVEARLLTALSGKADQPVTDAMRYAVRGGKRLRGFLVLGRRADAWGAGSALGFSGGGDRGFARL
jgi:geranylgeranyl pyrophosphate synthase